MKQQEIPLETLTESTLKPVSFGKRQSNIDLDIYLKILRQLINVITKIHLPKKPFKDDQIGKTLRDAITISKSIALTDLIAFFEEEARKFEERHQELLKKRREHLLMAARTLGIPYKRFEDYDRVGPFKVSYKGKKVWIEIGSELAQENEEVEGQKILEIIQEQLVSLEKAPFSRESFFLTIKDALKLAQDKGQSRDGWVPVRTVYTYFSLLRNLQFEDFLKKPGPKNFREYSPAQFVYDLAKFGRPGWSIGEETLRSMTPNMATVAAGKAMTLPDLEAVGGYGIQFAVLKIEKKGKSIGAERSPSKTR